VNQVIERMGPNDEWVHIHADDHRFNPDLLLRLLDHQLPIVAPLVSLRSPGFPPSLFHETEGGYVGYSWQELDGKSGLMPVDTYGGPMAVIRREVIETLGQPFFTCKPNATVAPQEDLYTFARCRAAGYQPMVDLDLWLGHCFPGVVYPHRTPEGKYVLHIASHETLGFMVPQSPEDAAQLVNETYHAYS
jgi:hypothetical protein